jgi:hypothetical protein
MVQPIGKYSKLWKATGSSFDSGPKNWPAAYAITGESNSLAFSVTRRPS